MFHAQGALITLSDTESEGSHAAAAGRGARMPDVPVPCCSDPGAMPAASAASSATSSERGGAAGDDGAADGADSARERRGGVLAALLLRLERSPKRGPGNVYWTDAGEPDESEIAHSFEHSDGDDGVQPRCALLDDDASSDGTAQDDGGTEHAAGPASPSAPKRRRLGLFKGPHMVGQALPRAGSALRGTQGGAAEAGRADGTGPRRAVLARLDAADVAMESSEGDSTDGGAQGKLADSDSDGAVHHSPGALRDEDGTPRRAAADDEGPRLTAAQRRRARRELAEAEMKDADPEGYERIMAVRNALAPYGWDKYVLACAIAELYCAMPSDFARACRCHCVLRSRVGRTG